MNGTAPDQLKGYLLVEIVKTKLKPDLVALEDMMESGPKKSYAQKGWIPIYHATREGDFFRIHAEKDNVFIDAKFKYKNAIAEADNGPYEIINGQFGGKGTFRRVAEKEMKDFKLFFTCRSEPALEWKIGLTDFVIADEIGTEHLISVVGSGKPTLEDAVRLAVAAHRGQRDKVGQPYILHPLRVMFRLTTETEQMVGVLHDVIEDTKYTANDLRNMGYSDEVLQALDRLTRRKDESYEDFVFRAKGNPIARKVKLADLEDNMDPKRMSGVSVDDLERLIRYRRAWAELQE
jgi:hypothetical protein